MSIAQDDEAAEEDDFFDAGPPPAVGSQAQAEGSLQEEEDLVDLTSNVETHQEGQYKSKNMMGTLAKAVNKFGKSRSTSNEADMVIRPKSRKPKINYENTYKSVTLKDDQSLCTCIESLNAFLYSLRTEPDNKFSSGAAKKIINAILDEHFTEDMEYATDVSRALVRRMANDIKYRCKKLGFKRLLHQKIHGFCQGLQVYNVVRYFADTVSCRTCTWDRSCVRRCALRVAVAGMTRPTRSRLRTAKTCACSAVPPSTPSTSSEQ